MNFIKDASFLGRAYRFAEAAHSAVGHLRKYTGSPYICHPIAVASLVLTVASDEATVVAALLHDTVEDTKITLSDIEREFGPEVARLVGDITNVSCVEDGNRAVRKELDRQHIAKADPRAKTVKLADVIDNVRSIVEHDPDFARVYLQEKERLLDVLVGGHPAIYQLAVESVREAKEDLAARPPM